MTLKSVEELRRELLVCGCDPEACPTCAVPHKVCDGLFSVEREIERDYIRLPRLDDGVVNVGDWVESDYGEVRCVREIEAIVWSGDRWDFQFSDEPGDTRDCASIDDFYACSRHVVKPRKLYDVLAELENGELSIDDAESEIRELMEVRDD